MLDRDQLETFATVVEQQSFDRAATVLSITRGAVSQRIKALEESLSTILVKRERPVAATHAGEVLLRHVKALRILEGSALQELTPTAKPHAPVSLAIAVNADSLATWFPEVLRELLLGQLVALEVVTDDQDHTSALLARGDVIGCISTSAKPADGFIAECLGAMEYRCYATPDFAHSHFPSGLTVPAVLSAPAVLFNRKDSLHDDFLKVHFGFAVERYARHYLPSPVALLEGVAMGAGYGLIPSSQAAPLVEAGQLVDVCPSERVMVDLFWHHWDLEPPLASDITALIVKVARLSLEPSAEFSPSSPNTGEPARPSTSGNTKPQGHGGGQEAPEHQ
jgi:LysR family transcriptional regulator (chromosome initiation inhibitor)